jgi:hypothetical protein
MSNFKRIYSVNKIKNSTCGCFDPEEEMYRNKKYLLGIPILDNAFINNCLDGEIATLKGYSFRKNFEVLFIRPMHNFNIFCQKTLLSSSSGYCPGECRRHNKLGFSFDSLLGYLNFKKKSDVFC